MLAYKVIRFIIGFIHMCHAVSFLISSSLFLLALYPLILWPSAFLEDMSHCPFYLPLPPFSHSSLWSHDPIHTEKHIHTCIILYLGKRKHKVESLNLDNFIYHIDFQLYPFSCEYYYFSFLCGCTKFHCVCTYAFPLLQASIR